MYAKITTAFGFLLALTLTAQAQIVPPTDVAGLTAEAGDRSVILNWEAADDDGFISGYKVYYGTEAVVEADDSYDDDTFTNSAESTFTVENLLNGVDYYFSVTAIDDDQEESENYSNEASATPVSPNGDTEGPKVISATHSSAREITVQMSESIKPVDPSAFLVLNQDTFDEIVIEDIRYNSENVVFTIPVDSLAGGVTYDITATSAVEDLAGNPVSSGVTDTVSFVAQADFAVEEEPVVEEVVEEEPIEEEPVEEPVVEDEVFEEFEDIFEQPAEELPVIEAPIEEIAEEVKPSAPDNVAPLEAQNLQADTSGAESTNQVQLSWEPALDLDNDIADQVLYVRSGLGDWDEGYSMGKSASEATVDVQPNQNYQVRLVTIDQSGNGSEGAVFSFSTNLTQSGPGTVIALALAFVVGMMMLLSSRRRA